MKPGMAVLTNASSNLTDRSSDRPSNIVSLLKLQRLQNKVLRTTGNFQR
jgi:hypothetical protein